MTGTGGDLDGQMGHGKLKPREGGDLPKVTQLVDLTAGTRSWALPSEHPLCHIHWGLEGAQAPPGLPECTHMHLVVCYWAGAINTSFHDCPAP